MYTNVTETMFIEEFRSMDRMENFSIDGLRKLYEFFTDLEEDTGQEVEMDVIAICCDLSELTIDDVITEYPDLFDQDEMLNIDEEEKYKYIIDTLNDETVVIPVDDDRVIIQAF